MTSRMDRYRQLDNNQARPSRSSKNSNLYDSIGSNTQYTNFTDVSKIEAIELDEARRNSRTREGYKAIKEYGESPKTTNSKRLDEINYLYKDHENRVYDINSVLEKAKSSREEKDELEGRRKLKDTNYNILASLDIKELEKYRREKQKRVKKDEEELRNLIDTITSKTLTGEISKETTVNLLSDLMATSAIDRVDDGLDLDEVKEEENKEEKDDSEKDKTDDLMKGIDKSFYTKSMDLSDKDFDFSDEEEEEAKIPLIVKILLILILLVIIGVGAFFIIKNI